MYIYERMLYVIQQRAKATSQPASLTLWGLQCMDRAVCTARGLNVLISALYLYSNIADELPARWAVLE
jgi:hypothetical protein